MLLAAQPDEAVARYLRTVRLERLTDVTETDPVRLLDIVRTVRADGYSIVVDQLAYGVSSIAVPIMAGPGRAIAAVNSSGYSGRLSPETLVETRLAELRRTAAQISETLLRYPALRHSLERDGGESDPDRVVA